MRLDELKAAQLKNHDSLIESITQQEDSIKNSTMSPQEKRQALKSLANKRLEKGLVRWQVDSFQWDNILNQ